MSAVSGNYLGKQPTTEEEEVYNYDYPPLSAEELKEAKYLHPDAKRLFDLVPCMRRIPIMGPAVQAFGPKCVFSLGAVYVMSKGLSKSLLKTSIYPMYMKEFKTTASAYQRISGIISMGWSIKPLSAILCDSFAIFGYTKRWYIFLSCLIGGVCALGYGLLPASLGSVHAAAALLFVTNFCMANVDVLSEGHYSRLVRKHPKPGADLISWVWGLISVGSIIASSIQGPVSDIGKPRVGAFLSTGLQILCGALFIFNWYGEKRNHEERTEDYLYLMEIQTPTDERMSQTKNEQLAITEPPVHQDAFVNDDMELAAAAAAAEKAAKTEEFAKPKNDLEAFTLQQVTCCGNAFEVNTEVMIRNKRVTAYGVLMTAGVLTMAVLTIIGETYWLLYGCVTVSVVLCGFGFYALPFTVAKANVFSYIQLASYISIPGALDTFYMAEKDCLPDGPQFTQTFYNTVGAIIGNIGGLVGVYLFSAIFSKRSYRLTFFVTTIILVVGSIFDLILVERWNRPHVNDHALYILGDSIVGQVCFMLNYMPMNFLIARLCPKGSESTMFAILAGFSNLGDAMGNTIGTILMETVWPVKTSPPCDFSNVKWLIIVGHLIAPLVCLPLVFVLIPAGRVCDALKRKDTEFAPIFAGKKNSSSGLSSQSESNNEPIDVAVLKSDKKI